MLYLSFSEFKLFRDKNLKSTKKTYILGSLIIKCGLIMNARKRLNLIMNHEEADIVPSFELSIDNLDICQHFGEKYVFQGLNDSFQKTYNLCNGDISQTSETILAATESRSYMKNTINHQINLYQKIGIDLLAIPLTGYILFPQICYESHFIDEFGRVFDLKKNPSDNMDLAYYQKGYFANFEEYQEFGLPKPDSERRKKYMKMMKKMEEKNKGEVAVIPAIWGVFEPVWQPFGFTNFSKLLSKPKQIQQIFTDRGQFALDLVEYFIEWGEEDFIMFYDDFGYKTGLLMSPRLYRKYVIPWHKKICEKAHEKGVKIILHSCGDIYEIFKDLVAAGIDAIHPIEPTTANPDYDIFKLQEKYGDRLTFLGNVSPQDLADKSPEYIRKYTKKLISKLAPEGGFILSSGHSINPAVKLENFLAMHDIIKEYGEYPIK